MSLKGLAHLSYVRERVHGHVFIVRCQSADGTEVAGATFPTQVEPCASMGRPTGK